MLVIPCAGFELVFKHSHIFGPFDVIPFIWTKCDASEALGWNCICFALAGGGVMQVAVFDACFHLCQCNATSPMTAAVVVTLLPKAATTTPVLRHLRLLRLRLCRTPLVVTATTPTIRLPLLLLALAFVPLPLYRLCEPRPTQARQPAPRAPAAAGCPARPPHQEDERGMMAATSSAGRSSDGRDSQSTSSVYTSCSEGPDGDRMAKVRREREELAITQAGLRRARRCAADGADGVRPAWAMPLPQQDRVWPMLVLSSGALADFRGDVAVGPAAALGVPDAGPGPQVVTDGGRCCARALVIAEGRSFVAAPPPELQQSKIKLEKFYHEVLAAVRDHEPSARILGSQIGLKRRGALGIWGGRTGNPVLCSARLRQRARQIIEWGGRSQGCAASRSSTSSFPPTRPGQQRGRCSRSPATGLGEGWGRLAPANSRGAPGCAAPRHRRLMSRGWRASTLGVVRENPGLSFWCRGAAFAWPQKLEDPSAMASGRLSGNANKHTPNHKQHVVSNNEWSEMC